MVCIASSCGDCCALSLKCGDIQGNCSGRNDRLFLALKHPRIAAMSRVREPRESARNRFETSSRFFWWTGELEGCRMPIVHTSYYCLLIPQLQQSSHSRTVIAVALLCEYFMLHVWLLHTSSSASQPGLVTHASWTSPRRLVTFIVLNVTESTNLNKLHSVVFESLLSTVSTRGTRFFQSKTALQVVMAVAAGNS